MPQAIAEPDHTAGPWHTLRRWELPLVIALGLAILLPGLTSFTLIDPWEGHYGEVARRMLEEDDWVKLQWQNEPYFRSKPGLTFWLMASSMKLHGVASDGGYSGEMVASGWSIWALRLPFVLMAVLGVTLLWLMLARLVSKRVAWIGWGVAITTPFYGLVARQAITDMPAVATAMGAVACFLLAIHAGERTLEPIFKRVNAYHIFIATLVLFVGVQLWRIGIDFTSDPSTGRGIKLAIGGARLHPAPIATLPFLAGLIGFCVLTWWVWPTRYARQVYMYWAYLLVGVSVWAKGPAGVIVVVVTCGLYVIATANWRFVLRASLPQGLAIMALAAGPWHLAMLLKDGRPWVSEYFGHHWGKRATAGVHGERGTFDFYVQQIGIGMWPWVALVPAALAAAVNRGRAIARRDQVRLAMVLWALGGFVAYAMVETKFHHYILPVVPAFGVLIAFWADDVLAGRVRRIGLLLAVGVGITLFVARDLIGEQKQLIELFIYRYDRPWPKSVDLSGVFWWFALVCSALLVAMMFARIRRYAMAGFAAAALAFAFWVMNGYMGAAAPHWGQGALHHTYYRERAIHGVDIQYYGLRDLADEWGGTAPKQYRVRSVLPDELTTGLPMTVHIEVPPLDESWDLQGTVSKLGDDAFWIEVPQTELAKLSDPIARGKTMDPPAKRPWSQVNADRLVAWQLNWRGENWWSAGEIWGRTKDTQTVFVKTDNKEFLEYMNVPERRGQRFFVITESGRADGLRSVLPTESGKDSVKKIDTSCNKFTLLQFTL